MSFTFNPSEGNETDNTSPAMEKLHAIPNFKKDVSETAPVMQKMKLFYFPAMGRPEPLRILMHFAKMNYEDVFITKEDWPNHKKSMPGK